MQRTRLTADARKLAIVQAALPLFAQKGFASTTTKDLARAAGVSEPLLYRHFPSKEALYAEIQNFTCKNVDPVLQRLSELAPSTSTLVQLLYYLMRSLIVDKPAGEPAWHLRHRLMMNSLLDDGTFARLVYETRFDCFCLRMEECLEAAVRSGDAIPVPISHGNRARFAHHVGAWVACAHLPPEPAIDYHAGREELLSEAMWFALRGMGLTDKAITAYYDPKALSLLFDEPAPAAVSQEPFTRTP